MMHEATYMYTTSRLGAHVTLYMNTPAGRGRGEWGPSQACLLLGAVVEACVCRDYNYSSVLIIIINLSTCTILKQKERKGAIRERRQLGGGALHCVSQAGASLQYEHQHP